MVWPHGMVGVHLFSPRQQGGRYSPVPPGGRWPGGWGLLKRRYVKSMVIILRIDFHAGKLSFA